ncbi:MAG: hypothetical protein WC575_03090 [Patescibacteria group bacterium]
MPSNYILTVNTKPSETEVINKVADYLIRKRKTKNKQEAEAEIDKLLNYMRQAYEFGKDVRRVAVLVVLVCILLAIILAQLLVVAWWYAAFIGFMMGLVMISRGAGVYFWLPRIGLKILSPTWFVVLHRLERYLLETKGEQFKGSRGDFLLVFPYLVWFGAAAMSFQGFKDVDSGEAWLALLSFGIAISLFHLGWRLKTEYKELLN